MPGSLSPVVVATASSALDTLSAAVAEIQGPLQCHNYQSYQQLEPYLLVPKRLRFLLLNDTEALISELCAVENF